MTEAEEKDAILIFLNNTNNPTTVESISNIVSNLGMTKQRVEMLCTLIKDDEYIVYTHGPDGACKIKHKGRAFLEQGGYSQQERITELQKKKAETKEELEIQQLKSVIATNVATTSAYINQDKQNRRTLLLTAISVIFITISTILQLSSKTDNELHGIKEQLKETSKKLDSIQSSRKTLDSNMMIFFKQYYKDSLTKGQAK